MNIISFPVDLVLYSHDNETFQKLGFEIIDNGLEGSYIKLPNNWHGSYHYHTPFDFCIVVTDANRQPRAYASLLGQTANFELIPRYCVVNYKPWLSPYSSELRLKDNKTGQILFAQTYTPKLIPNKTSTDLIAPQTPASGRDYETAYRCMLKYCEEHDIDLDLNNPVIY